MNETFGAKEVMNCVLYEMDTKKPFIYFDSLKTSEITVTSEKVYARGGRGNAKLITWELNKEAMLNITDALISPKSMELISGLKRKTGGRTIHMRQSTIWDVTDPDMPIDTEDKLIANATGVINLAFTPIESVNDILVYEYDDDCGTPLAMTGATLTSNALTIAAAANKRVVVYYTFKGSDKSETYTIDSSHFSGTYKLVGDTVIRNRNTGKDEAFQIVLPNLKWSSALTLSFAAEGDPTPTSFECEIMQETGGKTLIEMTKW